MSSENGPILVPVDFSKQSFIALSQSYNLARLTNSSLRLIHVVDQDFFSSFTEGFLAESNYANSFKNDLQNKLDQLAVKIKTEEGIKATTILRTGKIYHEIVEESATCNASLIIMGTMGSSTLMKKFLGSNASRVLREAQCPVITIKGTEHRKGCDHIVLPLDLTKETKEKVNKAIELAQLYKSHVHLVTIVENNDEFIVRKLERQMEQVKDFFDAEKVPCTTAFVENENVAEGINEYAQKVNADLIVIMTQQEVDFTDLFLGSKAQEVINLLDIPVLCIRPVKRKDLTEFVLS
jgi:nucleotide-binding universal stress UspA family protein